MANSTSGWVHKGGEKTTNHFRRCNQIRERCLHRHLKNNKCVEIKRRDTGHKLLSTRKRTKVQVSDSKNYKANTRSHLIKLPELGAPSTRKEAAWAMPACHKQLMKRLMTISMRNSNKYTQVMNLISSWPLARALKTQMASTTLAAENRSLAMKFTLRTRSCGNAWKQRRLYSIRWPASRQGRSQTKSLRESSTRGACRLSK